MQRCSQPSCRTPNSGLLGVGAGSRVRCALCGWGLAATASWCGDRCCCCCGPSRQLCGRDLRALAAPARCPEAALPARHSRQRRRHRRLDRARRASRPRAREGSSNRGSRKFAGNRRERGCERPEGAGVVAGGALNGTRRPQGGRAASPRPRDTQAALSRHPAGAKQLINCGFARQRLIFLQYPCFSRVIGIVPINVI